MFKGKIVKEITPTTPRMRNVGETPTVNKNLEVAFETDATDNVTISNNVQQQLPIDSSMPTCSKQTDSTVSEAGNLQAEPLEHILNSKIVRERQMELEKKLDKIRKKHDKKKLRIMALKLSPSQEKRKKFGLTNKLVKRLSSKTL